MASAAGRHVNSGCGSCHISPLVEENRGAGAGGGRWWELEQGLGAGGQRDGGGGAGPAVDT